MSVSANNSVALAKAAAVSPSDTVDLANPARGLYVGVSGDVKVDMVGGGTVTLKAMAAGVIHFLRIKRIYNTGTTATNMVALY